MTARSCRPWLLLGLALLACEEGETPATTEPATPALASAEMSPDVTLQGTIALPINQSFSGTGVAFGITQTGTGPAGSFKIGNSANSQDAFLGRTTGTGNAVHGVATGNGTAAKFENTSSTNGGNTLYAFSAGAGNTISAVSTGTGPAGLFITTSTSSSAATLSAQQAGTGTAVRGLTTGSGNAGYFEKASGTSGGATLLARSRGITTAANFVINNPSSFADAAFIYTDGTAWAGHFVAASATGKGVFIETRGGAGLQVVGGSKNAVVGTLTGARALYTEESTEVWFTDYGFGRLDHGRAHILLDPVFAQTIDPAEPYHVFVQAYGDAEIYVTDRTPTGFVVQLRGGDPAVEFSYRLVAKRLGFEGQRLERAPWADGSVDAH